MRYIYDQNTSFYQRRSVLKKETDGKKLFQIMRYQTDRQVTNGRDTWNMRLFDTLETKF